MLLSPVAQRNCDTVPFVVGADAGGACVVDADDAGVVDADGGDVVGGDGAAGDVAVAAAAVVADAADADVADVVVVAAAVAAAAGETSACEQQAEHHESSWPGFSCTSDQHFLSQKKQDQVVAPILKFETLLEAPPPVHDLLLLLLHLLSSTCSQTDTVIVPSPSNTLHSQQVFELEWCFRQLGSLP